LRTQTGKDMEWLHQSRESADKSSLLQDCIVRQATFKDRLIMLLHLEVQGGAECLVMERNGQLVAWGSYTNYSKGAYIYNLYVIQEWRRKGLGSSLVKQLMQEATQPVYLHSPPSLVSFFTHLGFVPSHLVGKHTGLEPMVYINTSEPVSVETRKMD
jgi:GNAT superfamily N-acetyltransferase